MVNIHEKSIVEWRWRDASTGRVRSIQVGDRSVLADGDLREAKVDQVEVSQLLKDLQCRVTVLLALDDRTGSIGIEEIRYKPVETPGHLTRSQWNALKIGELQRVIEAKLPLVQMLLPDEWRRSFDAPRPGRRGHTIEYYALWVDRYLEACDEGRNKTPMKMLIEKHPGMSRSALNAIVEKAEVLKLIKGRTRGKAGGTMTAKCRRILDGKR